MSPLTRREFVRLSAATTAAVTVLEPLSLWSQEPAQKVKFASIGLGVRGCELLKAALQVPGAECVGFSDLYDGRLRAGREIVGKDLPSGREYRQLLENKDIEAIILAVPDHAHRRLLEEACAAGKDVYCEKPMSHTVSDGFAMVRAARQHQRIVQIGSQRVSSVVYAKAREMWQSGRLGEVTVIEAHSDRNSPSGAWVYPIPPDASEQTIDWNTFLIDAPKRPFDAARFFRWRCFRDYGEGLAGDLFVHLISGIHFVTGVNAPPQRALSLGGLFHYKDGRDFPDVLQTLYDYPEFQVTLRCNQNNDAGESVVFYGTKGTMTVTGSSVTFRAQDTRPHPEGYSIWGWPSDQRALYLAEWNKEHPAPAPLTQSTEPDSEVFQAPPGYNDTLDHVANFFQSVRKRKAPVENEEFGNNAALACHMANASHFSRAVATWDAAGEKIRT